MAASDARGRGGARGDSPLEHYVRQLLREADRMRRATPPRTGDRSLMRPPVGPSQDPPAETPPPAAA